MTIFNITTRLNELRRAHYVCDDCWYSCPASGECCNDSSGSMKCDCGAAEHNAKLELLIAECADANC